MEERASGAVVGSIGGFHREPRSGPDDTDDLEVGWSLVRRFRGRGMATEGGRAMMAHVFDTMKPSRVIAHVDHDNPASIRVAEKIGMRYERDVEFYDTRLRRYELTAKSMTG
jgi:[ribosomal protein S5]-alanine N-acetyltransferase